MNCGPTTFQWMCLRVSCRSINATRRSWSVAITAVVASLPIPAMVGLRGSTLGGSGGRVLAFDGGIAHDQICTRWHTPSNIDRWSFRSRKTAGRPRYMDETMERVDVAIIGGGSEAETLVSELDASGFEIVVFEESRVGGECPFVACMPTKAMLHDAAVGRSWSEAVRRRTQVVDGLDDGQHAAELARHGATLVRQRASITGPARSKPVARATAQTTSCWPPARSRFCRRSTVSTPSAIDRGPAPTP